MGVSLATVIMISSWLKDSSSGFGSITVLNDQEIANKVHNLFSIKKNTKNSKVWVWVWVYPTHHHTPTLVMRYESSSIVTSALCHLNRWENNMSSYFPFIVVNVMTFVSDTNLDCCFLFLHSIFVYGVVCCVFYIFPYLLLSFLFRCFFPKRKNDWYVIIYG